MCGDVLLLLQTFTRRQQTRADGFPFSLEDQQVVTEQGRTRYATRSLFITYYYAHTQLDTVRKQLPTKWFEKKKHLRFVAYLLLCAHELTNATTGSDESQPPTEGSMHVHSRRNIVGAL